MKSRIINRFIYSEGKFINDLLFSVGTLVVATILSAMLVKGTGANNNVTSIYMLAIIIIALRTSKYYWGIMASIIGVIGSNYIFTYPYFKLNFTISGYPLMFITMLLVSIITSTMTTSVKNQMNQARAREERTKQLHTISQKLLTARGSDRIVSITMESMRNLTGNMVVFYNSVPEDEEHIKNNVGFINCSIDYGDELRELQRAFHSRKTTGKNEHNDNMCRFIYIPIVLRDKVYGVAGMYCDRNNLISQETLSFVKLILAQTALAIEKQKLIDEQKLIEVESEKEKIKGNLLRAISHDIRTPLTGILGASGVIIEGGEKIDKECCNKLVQDIHEDAGWLLNMVENLLSVTRISGDSLNLVKDYEAAEEVIGEAARRIRKRFPKARLKIKVPDELILVPMDATLICQVLINLIENAVKYGDSNGYIEISVDVKDNDAVFSVRDHGPGISKEYKERLFSGFEKRNHKNNDSSRGLGIGLSICKSVVNAHGGEISGINCRDGGALFTFTIPMGGN